MRHDECGAQITKTAYGDGSVDVTLMSAHSDHVNPPGNKIPESLKIYFATAADERGPKALAMNSPTLVRDFPTLSNPRQAQAAKREGMEFMFPNGLGYSGLVKTTNEYPVPYLVGKSGEEHFCAASPWQRQMLQDVVSDKRHPLDPKRHWGVWFHMDVAQGTCTGYKLLMMSVECFLTGVHTPLIRWWMKRERAADYCLAFEELDDLIAFVTIAVAPDVKTYDIMAIVELRWPGGFISDYDDAITTGLALFIGRRIRRIIEPNSTLEPAGENHEADLRDTEIGRPYSAKMFTGCDFHFEQSCTRYRKDTTLVPVIHQHNYYASCQAMKSGSLLEYEEGRAWIAKHLPKCKWWLSWWTHPDRVYKWAACKKMLSSEQKISEPTTNSAETVNRDIKRTSPGVELQCVPAVDMAFRYDMHNEKRYTGASQGHVPWRAKPKRPVAKKNRTLGPKPIVHDISLGTECPDKVGARTALKKPATKRKIPPAAASPPPTSDASDADAARSPDIASWTANDAPTEADIEPVVANDTAGTVRGPPVAEGGTPGGSLPSSGSVRRLTLAADLLARMLTRPAKRTKRPFVWKFDRNSCHIDTFLLMELTAYTYREDSFVSNTQIVTANEAILVQCLKDCLAAQTATELDTIRTSFWKVNMSHINFGDVGDFVEHCEWVCKGNSSRKRKATAPSEYASSSRERLTADRMVVYSKTATSCTKGCPDPPIDQYCVSYLNLPSFWCSSEDYNATPIKIKNLEEAVMRKLIQPDQTAITCQQRKCFQSGSAAGKCKEAKDITSMNLPSLLVLAAEEQAYLEDAENLKIGHAEYVLVGKAWRKEGNVGTHYGCSIKPRDGLWIAYDDIVANENMLKYDYSFTKSPWATTGKPRAWYYIRVDKRNDNIVDMTAWAEVYNAPSYFGIPDQFIDYN
jgi:hypothetical protein